MLYRITGQSERLAEELTAAKLKMEPALDSEGNVLAAATLNVHLATQCIRDALQTPSLVFGFFEPYLPYYDLIRNEPEFQALLAEIEATP